MAERKLVLYGDRGSKLVDVQREIASRSGQNVQVIASVEEAQDHLGPNSRVLVEVQSWAPGSDWREDPGVQIVFEALKRGVEAGIYFLSLSPAVEEELRQEMEQEGVKVMNTGTEVGELVKFLK